jgi:hypothetical protein
MLTWDSMWAMSEKGEIRRDGMTALKNSGRGKIQKGDATWHRFVVDIKEYGKSYSVSRKSWQKICSDALRTDREKDPALKLVLGEGSSKVRLGVIEWDILEELVEFWNNNQ